MVPSRDQGGQKEQEISENIHRNLVRVLWFEHTGVKCGKGPLDPNIDYAFRHRRKAKPEMSIMVTSLFAL